jgi:hypothetical protein
MLIGGYFPILQTPTIWIFTPANPQQISNDAKRGAITALLMSFYSPTTILLVFRLAFSINRTKFTHSLQK